MIHLGVRKIKVQQALIQQSIQKIILQVLRTYFASKTSQHV